MLRWLPPSLIRLYQRLANAVPYARKTRPRPIPPDDERPSSGQARHYRLEIAYDAFCEHRPPPKKLFRANPWRRDLTSWCDAPNSWTDRRKPRCHHCETARAHYIAARDHGDWKAEVALYKLARRGAVRLLAERRQYRESRRQFWARHREHVARNGPEPMPPQFEPELWPMIAHRGSHESWHHRDRREVERGLVRAHARHLRREIQRRKERLRDLGAGEALRAAAQPDASPGTSSSRGAKRRSDPGQREKRLPAGHRSPRRRKAARDGDAHATGATEPTADAAPSADAADTAPAPDPMRVSRHKPPKPTDIKIGAARPTIPPPRASRDRPTTASGDAAPRPAPGGTRTPRGDQRPRPLDLRPGDDQRGAAGGLPGSDGELRMQPQHRPAVLERVAVAGVEVVLGRQSLGQATVEAAAVAHVAAALDLQPRPRPAIDGIGIGGQAVDQRDAGGDIDRASADRAALRGGVDRTGQPDHPAIDTNDPASSPHPASAAGRAEFPSSERQGVHGPPIDASETNADPPRPAAGAGGKARAL